jgi:hypothetical protein
VEPINQWVRVHQQRNQWAASICSNIHGATGEMSHGYSRIWLGVGLATSEAATKRALIEGLRYQKAVWGAADFLFSIFIFFVAYPRIDQHTSNTQDAGVAVNRITRTLRPNSHRYKGRRAGLTNNFFISWTIMLLQFDFLS